MTPPVAEHPRISALSLDDSLLHEIDSQLSRLAPDSACIMSGSLIEGFGNKTSDIDLHIIHPAGGSRVSAAIGLRAGNYVDCEYITLASLAALGARMSARSDRFREALDLESVIRYYRLATGISLASSPAVQGVLELFTPAIACSRSAEFAEDQEKLFLARAALANALDNVRGASLLLREADGWHAASVLARDGEGYPSNKWNAEKAARRYGRGSAKFRLVMSYLTGMEQNVTQAIDERRAALDYFDELDSQASALRQASGCRVFETSEGAILLTPRGSALKVSREVGALVAELLMGSSWTAATAERAGVLRIPADDYRRAMGSNCMMLRRSGILIEAAND